MKFQNPSLNLFLNGRKDGRTNERTSRNQYAPHFFKVRGIKRKKSIQNFNQMHNAVQEL